jgi:hypothetical protein
MWKECVARRNDHEKKEAEREEERRRTTTWRKDDEKWNKTEEEQRKKEGKPTGDEHDEEREVLKTYVKPAVELGAAQSGISRSGLVVFGTACREAVLSAVASLRAEVDRVTRANDDCTLRLTAAEAVAAASSFSASRAAGGDIGVPLEPLNAADEVGRVGVEDVLNLAGVAEMRRFLASVGVTDEAHI